MTSDQKVFMNAAEAVCYTFYVGETLPSRQQRLLNLLTAYERMNGLTEKHAPWKKQRIVDGERILLDCLECE